MRCRMGPYNVAVPSRCWLICRPGVAFSSVGVEFVAFAHDISGIFVVIPGGRRIISSVFVHDPAIHVEMQQTPITEIAFERKLWKYEQPIRGSTSSKQNGLYSETLHSPGAYKRYHCFNLTYRQPFVVVRWSDLCSAVVVGCRQNKPSYAIKFSNQTPKRLPRINQFGLGVCSWQWKVGMFSWLVAVVSGGSFRQRSVPPDGQEMLDYSNYSNLVSDTHFPLSLIGRQFSMVHCPVYCQLSAFYCLIFTIGCALSTARC